jgi:hypothetical protein
VEHDARFPRVTPRWAILRSRESLEAKENAARSPGRRVMVEAAGQLIHLFRDGLDYAFILHPGCGAYYPSIRSRRILVPARGAHGPSSAVSRSMSLYRAGLRLALFLPLGVAIPPAACPPCGCRVRRCEPRCHSALSGRGDYFTNRTRVRKRYTVGTTCLATSFCSRPGATDGQATPEPVTLI